MILNFPAHFASDVDGHAVALSVLDEHTALLRVAGGREFEPYASYAVVRNDWPDIDVAEKAIPGGRVLSIGEMEYYINDNPFQLVVKRRGETRFSTAKGALKLAENQPATLVRERDADERVYGMGELGETLDRSGRVHQLWNTDDWRRHPLQLFYCSIPFAIQMSSEGKLLHGLFIDNPGRQFHDLGAENSCEARYQVETGDLVVWLIFADTFAEMLERWTALTGRISRPPLWAIGYQQCRWSYFPESRVREIAKEMRARRIPCDVIYLDIQYMDDFRVFTWDRHRFPDPDKLIGDLRNDGFHTITIVDPGIKIDKEYELYREIEDQPGLVLAEPRKKPYIGEVWPGKVHYPDFTHPEMRKIWSRYQKRELLDRGIAGIWNDMNEPSNFIEQKVPDTLVHHDFGLHRTHGEIHNVYGHTMAETSCEGIREARPGQRPLVITRAGYAGVQRHAAVWTGDNESLWDNMPFDIQLNLSMGLSGISFVGCDIGGFGRNCTPELYARWIEWGVFQPFCRTHSSWETRDQEPWSFGEEVELVARRMIELRYELLPYLYTQFALAAEKGTPINRPLVFDYTTDPTTHHIADQFLCGGDLLVAPVLQPGVSKRLVYLPRGEWYHYWSGILHHGGEWIIADAPLGKPPIYVREGAIIPMSRVRQHTNDGDWAETFLDIWPGAELSGTLVEDDGSTERWRKGEELRTRFTGRMDQNRLHLNIEQPVGTYQSPRRHWTLRVHALPEKATRVLVDGAPFPFKLKDGVLVTPLDGKPGACKVTIDFSEEGTA